MFAEPDFKVTLDRPNDSQLELICRWAADVEVIGPFQEPFGWSPSRIEQADHPDVWLVSVGPNQAGFAFVKTQSAEIAEIGVTLLPRYRGRGCGRAAHEMLLNALRESAVTQVRAITFLQNVAEIRILLKLGFIPSIEPVRVGGSPDQIVRFRRDLPRAPNAAPLVLIVTGPAGVGKTTIYRELQCAMCGYMSDYHKYFIAGDIFAHISFPFSGTEEELEVKYDAMKAVLSTLLRRNKSIIVLDNIFRRKYDFDNIISYIESESGRPIVVYLSAPLSEVLRRNATRSASEALPDFIVCDVFSQSQNVIRTTTRDVHVIYNDKVERVIPAILSIVNTKTTE